MTNKHAGKVWARLTHRIVEPGTGRREVGFRYEWNDGESGICIEADVTGEHVLVFEPLPGQSGGEAA